MKFHAIEHTDVYGNKQLFIKLENSAGHQHLIKCGQKTYDAVKEMTEKEHPQNKPK